MLKYYKIESGRLAVAPNEEAADIVMMGSLSQEQRSVLVKEYEITEHTIASAFDSDELSRIEYDDDFQMLVEVCDGVAQHAEHKRVQTVDFRELAFVHHRDVGVRQK